MIRRLGELWPVRRAVALVVGIWDTFLRENRVIPAVLAVVALFVFAWIVAGSFVGAPEEEQPVSNRQDVAQSPENPDEATPPAPEVESPDTDSYAAYESKDPFRQLFEPADSAETTTPGAAQPGDGQADGSIGGSPNDNDATGNNGGNGSGGNQNGGNQNAGNGGPGGAARDQYNNDDNDRTPRTDPTAPDSSGSQGGGDRGDDRQNGSGGGDLFDSGGDLGGPQ